jgi:hypothetical protein
MYAHSGVQQIMCCVFVLFVFVLCLVCAELNEEERLICEEISNESTEAKPILRIIHRDK